MLIQHFTVEYAPCMARSLLVGIQAILRNILVFPARSHMKVHNGVQTYKTAVVEYYVIKPILSVRQKLTILLYYVLYVFFLFFLFFQVCNRHTKQGGGGGGKWC